MKYLGPKPVEHRAVVRMEVAKLGSRWSRIRGWLAWRLRPKFLKYRGRPQRLRWWICLLLIERLDVQIRPLLAEGRTLIHANLKAGRSSPEFMRGKRLTARGRILEARMLWLAYEGGAQFFDGSSDIELLHLAGMDIKHDLRKAR